MTWAWNTATQTEPIQIGAQPGKAIIEEGRARGWTKDFDSEGAIDDV